MIALVREKNDALIRSLYAKNQGHERGDLPARGLSGVNDDSRRKSEQPVGNFGKSAAGVKLVEWDDGHGRWDDTTAR